jgi:malate/lactate dehydrogenase
MSVETNGRRITREDLESAFQKVVGEGQQVVERTFPQSLVIGVAAALAVVTVAFLAGKRRGANRSSVVEIRRL